MTDKHDSQTENEVEHIGRIRTLKSLEKGDQITVYYNPVQSSVELHVEKFDKSFKAAARFNLSIMEVESLIRILEESVGSSKNK